jgi:ElaB/YqjD/DUF883 family membrane-anchored ribosome-binding protein
MTMTNDPNTTPGGEADMPLSGSKTGRGGRSGSRVPYPGMMGDGTEEQNLNQAGDPSARISEGEVDRAFGSAASAASRTLKEARTFLDKDQAKQIADKAKDAAAETLSTLAEKANAVRDQMQSSAEAARDWAKKQADSAVDGAKQLHAERPMVVLSVSAGAALAVGLLAGFVIGRATADDY